LDHFTNVLGVAVQRTGMAYVVVVEEGHTFVWKERGSIVVVVESSIVHYCKREYVE
jgi:hypothetical protein